MVKNIIFAPNINKYYSQYDKIFHINFSRYDAFSGILTKVS